jgi:hypothetical protein
MPRPCSARRSRGWTAVPRRDRSSLPLTQPLDQPKESIPAEKRQVDETVRQWKSQIQ